MATIEYKGFKISNALMRSAKYYWIWKTYDGIGISLYDIGEKERKRREKYELHIGHFATLEKAKEAIDKGYN